MAKVAVAALGVQVAVAVVAVASYSAEAVAVNFGSVAGQEFSDVPPARYVRKKNASPPDAYVESS
jgi:hypothetical protein